MRTIRYNENALRDFQDGLDYYDDISVSLADRFEEDFWKTIERIKSDPFHFQQRYSEVRIAFLNQFPFAVHFVVKDEIIEVITVLHSKRLY